VSEETKTVSRATSAKDRFPSGFDTASYWVSAGPTAFDIPNFRSRLPKTVKDLDEAAVMISPRDAKRNRYHVIFSWSVTAARVMLTIGYHSGTIALADSEVYDDSATPPSAEDFMAWLGQFFRVSVVECHIHTLFDYPLRTRKSMFPFTLTKRLPYGSTLYGVAVRLKTAPNGASSVRITKGLKRWYASVESDRRISFDDFSPYVDADASMAVLGRFLGEHSQ
jgi:hypothetical protein